MPIACFSQGRKLAEITIDAREAPGILADITRIFSNNNVNIIYTLADSSDGVIAKIAFFIDITNSKISISELIDLIKSQPYVINVNVWASPISGLIDDKLCFPKLVQKEPSIILSYKDLSFAIDRFRSIAGDGGAVIFYHIGFFIGEGRFKFFKSFLEKLNISKVETINVMLDVGRSYGLYDAKLIDLDPNKSTGIIHIYESFESTPIMGSRKEPSCHFVRGDIAGIISSILDKRVRVIERKCISAGNPYCELYFEPYS
jgi:predicted hydrocarbon binding protein/predicted amino acid-binding ACT domain protein